MITGEAAQDMVPDSSSSNSAVAAAASASASTAAAAGAQAKAAGVQGLATAVASAAGRKAQKLSGAAAGLVPQGWQLQKWPTEASEYTMQHGVTAYIGCYSSLCRVLWEPASKQQ